MSNNSTAVSNVIPFRFEAKEVRTLLVDDQPWFAAQDVLDALEYADTYKPSRAVSHVPEQWKGVQPLHTPGGAQQVMMVSEQGLYFVLGRSDKPKALPFQMWLAGDVLPSIRRTGTYADHSSVMTDLVGAVIGSSGEVVLDRVIDQKAYAVPKSMQRSFRHTMKSRLRSRFNVQRTALIPADCLSDACNFVAAYALEGEYIERSTQNSNRLNIHFPIDALTCRRPDMLQDRGDGHAWLDVKVSDLREGFRSPCEAILCELDRAGYDVAGAWWEIRTLRNKMGAMTSFITGLNRVVDEPQRYAIKDGSMA